MIITSKNYQYLQLQGNMVLVIDEISYLPINRDAANGFFQLVAARNENDQLY